MKLKSLLLMLCFSLFTNAFAVNLHLHPKVNEGQKTDKNLSYPGYCEIEIINDSYTDVFVSGLFDDDSYLDDFTIYRYERPHYVSLFYYNYCHRGMNLTVRTPYYGVIYSGWTPTSSTVRIVPYLGGVKAEVKK